MLPFHAYHQLSPFMATPVPCHLDISAAFLNAFCRQLTFIHDATTFRHLFCLAASSLPLSTPPLATPRVSARQTAYHNVSFDAGTKDTCTGLPILVIVTTRTYTDMTLCHSALNTLARRRRYRS